MKKKFLLIFVATILFLSIAISSFAMNNVANGVRNFVGGTENVIEDAGKGMYNGVKSGLNTVGEGARNVVTDTKSGMQDAGNTMTGKVTGNDNNNNNGYTATRTSTGDTTVAGMSTNTWSWIIIGITIAGIVALIWAYMSQKSKNDIYIDSDKM